MDEKNVYTPTCHLAVAVSDVPCGPAPKHYWPDTEANRAAGLATKLTLTEAEAKRFGTDLRKLGPAPADSDATEGTEVQQRTDDPPKGGHRPRVDRGYQPVSAGPAGVAPEPPSGGSAIQPPTSTATK